MMDEMTEEVVVERAWWWRGYFHGRWNCEGAEYLALSSPVKKPDYAPSHFLL
jgi:hypothetical protein